MVIRRDYSEQRLFDGGFFGGFLSISWKRLINTSLKSVPYEIGYIYIYFLIRIFLRIFLKIKKRFEIVHELSIVKHGVGLECALSY